MKLNDYIYLMSFIISFISIFSIILAFINNDKKTNKLINDDEDYNKWSEYMNSRYIEIMNQLDNKRN